LNSSVTPSKSLPAQGWSNELNKIICKYLSIGTVIAIILNPIFGLVDFMTLHEHWKQFMVLRVVVSIFMTACLLYKPLMKERPQLAGLVILGAVTTQDAYFYSLADSSIIQQLSLAYMADFVGASMVLMWSPVYAIVFIIYFVIVNLVFHSFYSGMPLQDFLSEGGLLVLAGAVFTMAMVVFRYHSVKSMIISKMELIRSNEWMAVQNEIIEQKSAELQKSNNRLKEFAYIVSHDLKAPLRGIRNIASWIREDCGNSINEEGMTHLKLMDKQIIKMENLIKAVLEYSKAGTTRSQAEWINLDELIKDVIEMVEVDNRTRFNIRTHIPQIQGTRIVLSQVLQNLLSNSIKHNDKEIREVDIDVIENDESINFVVSDNGPGINPADHVKIFDLFQTLRGDNSYESTGIGLPVAKKMIEEEGGNMWLESKPGSGAKFYFSLPKVK
jgi:signal transduction histidine kinase